MATKTLNDAFTVRVRKSDNTRRVSEHVQGDVGDRLAKCQTAEEMATYAAKFGIRADEIATRAKSAPNFGQFRMTIGNRIRGIQSRKSKNPNWTMAECAYPKEAAKARREAAKAKAAAKAPAKPVAKAAPKVIKKAAAPVAKPVVKKATVIKAKPVAPAAAPAPEAATTAA